MQTESLMRIVLVVGARPNFPKVAPIIDAITAYNAGRARQSSCINFKLVHTGQHYDDAMSKVFFDDLAIPRPDVNLEVGGTSHAQQTANVMSRFEPICIEYRPTHVVVVGDVNSTMACAIVAAKLGIQVVHVEAGLRSFDRAMPEEINRIVTDAISDYCFVTEKSGRENLLREGIPSEKVFFVGHVMIDTLLKYRARADASTVLEKLGLIDRHGLQHDSISDYAVLTLHRPSNVDEPLVLRGLIETLQRVAALLPVVFPCHPRTTTKIKEFGLTKWVRTDESIRGGAITAVPPLGYLDFLKLVAEARFVLTDSGGIQEETTVLGIPCITLRENTERPVTVTEGTNVLVGTSGEKILAAVNDVLTRKSTNVRVPELWDGHAARRIVDILVQRACTCGPRLGT